MNTKRDHARQRRGIFARTTNAPRSLRASRPVRVGGHRATGGVRWDIKSQKKSWRATKAKREAALDAGRMSAMPGNPGEGAGRTPLPSEAASKGIGSGSLRINPILCGNQSASYFLNTTTRAREVLAKTQDPEARFVAAYERASREATERTPKQPMPARKLGGGDGFMVFGQPVTVQESEDGYLTLQGSSFDGIEVDGLGTIPIDEGSLVRGGTPEAQQIMQAAGPRSTTASNDYVPFSPRDRGRGLFDRTDEEKGASSQQGSLGITRGEQSQDPATLTLAQRREQYPGIRATETVAQYERRMGTADTPMMFSPGGGSPEDLASARTRAEAAGIKEVQVAQVDEELASTIIAKATNAERRKFMREWFKDKRQTVKNEATGIEVGIGGKGIDHATAERPDARRTPEHFALLTKIDEAIRNGVASETVQRKAAKENILGAFRIFAPIQLQGKTYRAEITVRETNLGSRFYELDEVRIEEPAGNSADDRSLLQPSAGSAMSIGSLLSEVKPNDGDARLSPGKGMARIEQRGSEQAEKWAAKVKKATDRHAAKLAQMVRGFYGAKSQRLWYALIMGLLTNAITKAVRASGESGYTIALGSGVARSQISRMMRGQSDMNTESIERLADYLGLRITITPKASNKTNTKTSPRKGR